MIEHFITPAEERSTLTFVQSLAYTQYTHRGRPLKRRQHHFGADYAPTRTLGPAPALPTELDNLRTRVQTLCAAASECWLPDERIGAGHH